MGLLSLFTRKGNKVKDMLERGALVVDVRTADEFKAGHAPGSENMPLQHLSGKAAKLKERNKPVIFCCASGMRSGQATSMMKRQGIECINGGSWHAVGRQIG